MEIELNHFKTRAVFDRITKQYQDISFIQDTEQVHTHDHIYQFVTPDMKGKLDTIRKITYQEFHNLQQPLEDGFYLYDDLGIFVAYTNNNVSGVSDSYLYMITSNGVEIYKWVSNRYGNVGNIGELEITSNSETATISSTISATDTSEVEIPSATTTTAGLLSASDKIKINNMVLTCTGQEADGISMFENDSINGESFMRYCPERNIFYYFFSNYHPALSPEREYYRMQLGFDNETGFAAYIEKFQNNQWVDIGRLGEINQEFIRTNNSMQLTQNYASENNTVTIPNVTSELAGIMTAADKNKLDNIREFTEEKEEVIAHSLNDLNSRITELSENNTNLSEDIEETERVISLSLNDLNSRLNELNEIIEENELITASALNDLNERIQNSSNNLQRSNDLLRVFLVPLRDNDSNSLGVYFIDQTIQSIKEFCQNPNFLPKEIIVMFSEGQYYTLDNVSILSAPDASSVIHCAINFSGLSGDFEVEIYQDNRFSICLISDLISGGEACNTEQPIQVDNCILHYVANIGGEISEEEMLDTISEFGMPRLLLNPGLFVKISLDLSNP